MRTLITLGMLLASAGAHSGVAIEVERFNEDGERDSVVSIQVQDGKLRMDQIDEEDQRSASIYDGRRIIEANISERTYALIERDRLEAARKTSDPKRWLREQLLAEVPAQRRGDSIRMMSAPPRLPRQAGHITSEPTARVSHYAGIQCRVHRVIIDRQLRYEYCMASDSAAAPLKTFVDTGREMTNLLHEFFGLLGMPTMQDAMELFWTHVYDIEGVPLALREFEDGALVSESRIRSIESKDIDAHAFDIPAKLRRRAVLDFSAPASGLPSSDE